jgi:mannose-6-phosphate isomerase-like protein (cupin superfamily)
MKKANYFEIDGMEFPAGRRTRVIIGPNGAIEAEHFVQGIVTIYPGGSVPIHEHDEEEVYIILSGIGKMTVGDEIRSVKKGDAVYIPPGYIHSLKNIGAEDMEMLFTYAPKKIAQHWAEERDLK